MEPREASNPIDGVGIFIGVVFSLVGCALLVLATFVYAFYGYCDENCEPPTRTVSAALTSALPWELGGVALLAVASFFFMTGVRYGNSAVVRASLLGLLGAAVFEGGMVLVGVVINAGRTTGDGLLPYLLGLVALLVVWQPAFLLASRYPGPPR